MNKDIFIHIDEMSDEDEVLRKFMRKDYLLATSEFQEDGSFEEMEWVDYCFRYCNKLNTNIISPHEYFVVMNKYEDNNIYCSILKREIR